MEDVFLVPANTQQADHEFEKVELLKEILHRGDQLIAAYTRIIELQRENEELKESIAEQNELEREMLLALRGKK